MGQYLCIICIRKKKANNAQVQIAPTKPNNLIPRIDVENSFFLQEKKNQLTSNMSIQIHDSVHLISTGNGRPDEAWNTSRKLQLTYQSKPDLDDYKESPFSSSRNETLIKSKRSSKESSRVSSQQRRKHKDRTLKNRDHVPVDDQAFDCFYNPTSSRKINTNNLHIQLPKLEEGKKVSTEISSMTPKNKLSESPIRSKSKTTCTELIRRSEFLHLFNNDPEKLEDALVQQNQDKYYDSDDSWVPYVPLQVNQKHSKIHWKGSEVIGQGSFGKVLFGMNSETGQLMAIKQVELRGISKNDSRVRALEIEYNLLSSFEHKNIVSYYGMERTDNNINIFLEYIGGGSLTSVLKKFGAFEENLTKLYVKQILDGLDYLHRNGIMHRDIKGANVLVERSGVCKLADFGSGKQLHGLIQQEHDLYPSLSGTPNWMAPEVMEQEKYGRKADIWSVGCTMIEMTTGQPPWGVFSNPYFALFQISQQKSSPPIPENLSDLAKDFLSKCLFLDPKNRWTTKKLLKHPWFEATLEQTRPRNNSIRSIQSLSRSRASSVGQNQMCNSLQKKQNQVQTNEFVKKDSLEDISPLQSIVDSTKQQNDFVSNSKNGEDDFTSKGQPYSSNKLSQFHSSQNSPNKTLKQSLTPVQTPQKQKSESPCKVSIVVKETTHTTIQINQIPLVQIETKKTNSIHLFQQQFSSSLGDSDSQQLKYDQTQSENQNQVTEYESSNSFAKDDKIILNHDFNLTREFPARLSERSIFVKQNEKLNIALSSIVEETPCPNIQSLSIVDFTNLCKVVLSQESE